MINCYKPCIRKIGGQWVAIYWNGIQWITKPFNHWRTALFCIQINARYNEVNG